MPPTHDTTDPVPPVPQFDRAEFEDDGSGIPFCRKCKASIPDVYYDVNGNVVCPDCHARMIRPRQRWLRALKAFALGSLAAAVGAGVYCMITVGTGWNFSLEAIAVGYTVTGAASRAERFRGSGRPVLSVTRGVSHVLGDRRHVPSRGPRAALSSIPNEAREARKAAEKKAGDVKSKPDRSADTKPCRGYSPAQGGGSTCRRGNPGGGRGEGDQDEAGADRVEKDRVYVRLRERLPPGILGLLFLIGMLLVYAVLLLVLIYSLPIFIGFQSPISLLIFAVGLWQAWKMNAFTEVVITGPYRVRR